VEPDQLDPALAVRRPHHRAVDADALDPDDAVHPVPLDLRLPRRLEPELGEEGGRRGEIVDHDPDVVHPLNGHRPIVRRKPTRRGQ
jgi:hypothetical protein